jgi:bacillolysin
MTTLGALLLLTTATAQSPSGRRVLSLTADERDVTALRQADDAIAGMLRDGRLVRTMRTLDTMVSGADHQRLQQRYRGVPVWASTIAVQERDGVTVSTFGGVFTGLDGLGTVARLSPQQARDQAAATAGVELGAVPAPLYVLADEQAEPRLVYVVRAVQPSLLAYVYFIDAQTGAVVDRRLDTRLQSAAVGTGKGVFGADKKISTAQSSGQFLALDLLRPQQLRTYDLRGDIAAVIDVLNGVRQLRQSDMAADADNAWSDSAVVDAHVYSGWTYDFLYKRFNRLALEGATTPVINIVHPVRQSDFARFGSVASGFFADAGYYGGGVQIFGDGLPPGAVLEATGQNFTFMSGALDIVAHEIAHALTEHLAYVDEPGALSETFSDVIGTSVEHFFQPAGGSRGTADYFIGEDVANFGALRSMAQPSAINSYADHYTTRYRGEADNGGVHANAGIGNNVFYLAIEGGQNGTSGLAVTGVGAKNREQIEKIFYRAFTLMLPANATFSVARAATLQAARDLYGAGSAAETALRQAWTAVGVQ